MKKACKGFIMVFVLCMLTVIAYSQGNINVSINEYNVEYSKDTGFPFVDENSRTQVPFRATLEAFGAVVEWDNEKKLPFATYDGVKVYAPIGEKYIIVNDEKIENDTLAILKEGKTYCPIRKVLEAFGFVVEWDSKTCSVKAINENAGIPHPTLELQYSTINGTGKYSGYKILRGHPKENQYVVYFKHSVEGNFESTQVCYDIKKQENLKEKITWSYDGVSHTNTRSELYELFSDTSELMSSLGGTYNGEFSQSWYANTFGQVYTDWIRKMDVGQYAEEQVNAYIKDRLLPNPINFKINEKDWISSGDLREKYKMDLDSNPRGGGSPYLEYFHFPVIYRYFLSGYYDFKNGFLEFNKIRVISLGKGDKYFYIKDIEEYVIPGLNEEIEKKKKLEEKYK
ncbi:copper amine oxidase N-terminal domain-containing protein [Clostridiaceae bacterium M8S5]|nr:copper amine oxidase N-terminal domain-containing protein [Clostridiaceae bacterium M8S5]